MEAVPEAKFAPYCRCGGGRRVSAREEGGSRLPARMLCAACFGPFTCRGLKDRQCHRAGQSIELESRVRVV